jgi:hypothetical protein
MGMGSDNTRKSLLVGARRMGGQREEDFTVEIQYPHVIFNNTLKPSRFEFPILSSSSPAS